MIRDLVRQEPVVRGLWLSVPITMIVGVLAAFLYGENSSHRIVSTSIDDYRDRIAMIVQLTLMLGMGCVLVGQFHLRGRPWHLGLPIPARRLWVARMIAMSTATMLPVIAGFATYYLVNRNSWRSPNVEMGLVFLAIFFLFPFLYHARPTRSNRVDDFHPIVHWLVFTAIVLSAEVLAARYMLPFAIVGPACLGVAALLGTTTYLGLPRGFEVSGHFHARLGRAFEWRSFRWPRFLEIPLLSPIAPLNRAMRMNVLISFNLAAFALSCFMFTSVAVPRGKFLELYMLAFCQVTFFGLSLIGLPMVAHLPLSRTRLFVQCFAPGSLLAGGALLLGLSRHPTLEWGDVFSSRPAAAGFAAYAIVVFLSCSAVLVPLMTPGTTRRARLKAWIWRIAYGLFALAALVAALWPATGGMDAENRHTAELYGQVGAWIPGPSFVAWLVAVAIAAAAVIGLRVLFGRIELTWLHSRMQKWLEKFA